MTDGEVDDGFRTTPVRSPFDAIEALRSEQETATDDMIWHMFLSSIEIDAVRAEYETTADDILFHIFMASIEMDEIRNDVEDLKAKGKP